MSTVGGFYWSKSNVLEKSCIDTQKKRIVMKDLNNNIIKEFDSASDAAIILFNDKSKRSSISKCLTGKNKTAFGYMWQYK